jgi:hypothetical protein
MSDLKLVALDGEDLEVLAAHLQDAVLLVGDIAYLPKEERFAALVNRFDWASALTDGANGRKSYERRRSALRFERVRSCQTLHIRTQAKDAVLSLLTISFEPTDPPSGYLLLTFAGGAAVRLEVDYIEATLTDLGPVWRTRLQPRHPEGFDNPGVVEK